MNKQRIRSVIASVKWIQFNIVGDSHPIPHTFEFAAKVYLDEVIAILEEIQNDSDSL